MPVILLPGCRRKVYIPVYKHMFYMSEQQCYSNAVNCKYSEIPRIGYSTFFTLLFVFSCVISKWSHGLVFTLKKEKKNWGGQNYTLVCVSGDSVPLFKSDCSLYYSGPLHSLLLFFSEVRCYLQCLDSQWGCCLFYKVLTFYLLKQNLSLALCSLSFMSLIE